MRHEQHVDIGKDAVTAHVDPSSMSTAATFRTARWFRVGTVIVVRISITATPPEVHRAVASLHRVCVGVDRLFPAPNEGT